MGAAAHAPERARSSTIDIDLQAAALRGRVVSAEDGKSIVSANVALRPVIADLGVPLTRAATSDADGVFTFDLLQSGRYELRANRDGFAAHVEELQVGESGLADHVVRLNSAAGTTLVITDARDGRPLDGWASVRDASGRIVLEKRAFGASVAGELRLALGAGSYDAQIGAQAYAPRTISFTSPSRQNVGLTPGGTIAVSSKHATQRGVRLIDSAGRPALSWWRQTPVMLLLPSPATTTMQNIAPGRYTLQLLSPDEKSVTDSIEVVVVEGQTVRVEI